LISKKEKYEQYRPKKFLGQHFLVDHNIAKKIVRSCEIHSGDFVIEIGPGQGILTKYLSELTSNLTAVELDKSIYTRLTTEYQNNIRLIHGDFLKLDIHNYLNNELETRDKAKVVGNIPYNLTTEIIFKIYESKDKISSAVLMMQKEVAQRLIAQPDSKEYGILSILTQIHTYPKILFNVPPTAFFPQPNVHSSMVKFDFADIRYNIEDENFFKALVKKTFGKRRKTMKNSLKDFFQTHEIIPDEINFDFSRRPENVSVIDFVKLSNSIWNMKSKGDKEKLTIETM